MRILNEKTASVHFLINFADQRQRPCVVSYCHHLSRSPRHYWVCDESEGRREPLCFFRLLFQMPWRKSESLRESAIKKPLAGLTNQVKALPFFPRKKPIRGIVTGECSAKSCLCIGWRHIQSFIDDTSLCLRCRCYLRVYIDLDLRSDAISGTECR